MENKNILPTPVEVLNGQATDIYTCQISIEYLTSILDVLQDYWYKNSAISIPKIHMVIDQQKIELRDWNSPETKNLWIQMFDNFNNFLLNQINRPEILIQALRLAIHDYYFSTAIEMRETDTWHKIADFMVPFLLEHENEEKYASIFGDSTCRMEELLR